VRLPVHEIEDGLLGAFRAGGGPVRVLLRAPTGSGKSTAVPPMLVDAGVAGGRVLVVEPRRMAARMLARWVSRQRGGSVGGEIGHAVRFDTRYGKATKVVYVTDGVFQRWMQEEPELGGVGTVVFDEFHERRLAGDVGLARCLELQEGRRTDLRVVVMSATLELAGLEEYLSAGVRPATVLEAGGRLHPVEIEWRAARAAAAGPRRGGPVRETPVWERVAAVCREAVAAPDAGNVLAFLPGVHEIRRTVQLIEGASWSRGWDVFPLFGGLPPAAQDAAVAPGGRPKIIVATNIAETSLTIDGVRTVVDAGLARVAAFDPRRGIDTLHIRPISQASAEQRAGRAGRTAPGRCFRLWSEREHARRPAFETPEVRRVDLGEVMLLLLATGVDDFRGFRWLDAPGGESVARAERLLRDLGATDADGALTETGAEMTRLPLEPRWARLVMAAVGEGCLAEAAFIASAVQGEGIFSGRKGEAGRKDFLYAGEGSDFAGEWRAFDSAAAMNFDGRRCSQLGVLGRGAREIAHGLERLRRLAERAGWAWGEVDFNHRRVAVGRAMLAAFSDRLAVRFGEATLACRMVDGRRGRLDEESVVRDAPAFVAAEATEVAGRDVVVHLRRATEIDPAWLREMFPADWHETAGVAWDEARRRVVGRRETKFRDLVLERRDRDRDVDPDAAAELLGERVVADGLVLKKWNATVDQWTARLACLSEWMPELELPGWSDDDRRMAIAQMCHGAVSYKEVKDRDPWRVLGDWLSGPQRAALDAYAPDRIALPNGISAKVRYEVGLGPTVSLRVQQWFGVAETPRVADGRVPVRIEVLAPNQRPWQVTQDLAGFWRNGFPQMKKEMAGRYPKHPWPEDPVHAAPVVRGGKRGRGK
jgi:ATP-dependent helicase HrpB